MNIEFSQVLDCIRKDGGTIILYIKDKRDGSLWVEIHENTQEGCSVRSLLKGDAPAPRARMMITQYEFDNKVDYDLGVICNIFSEHYKNAVLQLPNNK